MAAVYFLIPNFEFGHMTSFEQQNETMSVSVLSLDRRRPCMILLAFLCLSHCHEKNTPQCLAGPRRKRDMEQSLDQCRHPIT